MTILKQKLKDFTNLAILEYTELLTEQEAQGGSTNDF